jgi:hypothetical protein
MRRAVFLLLAIIAICSLSLFSGRMQATELTVGKRYVTHSNCGPYGCEPRRRLNRCPDRLSCYPLYGAYGPYGGVAYWSEYSYGRNYYGWR